MLRLKLGAEIFPDILLHTNESRPTVTILYQTSKLQKFVIFGSFENPKKC